ncbi:MAG: FAD-dependent oxidoreductase [Rhodocyclaceae bacterium]
MLKKARFHLPRDVPVSRLMLAGDYVAGDHPATLEGAVRSGVAAARGILAAI